MSDGHELVRERFFADSPRYRYLETLGVGRTGLVFRVFDLDLDEDVALKVLTPASCAAPAVFEKVKREITLTRRIKHPNVIRFYEFGRAGSFPFVTMEFVPGRDLERILAAEGRLEPGRALGILRQVAFGVAAAHENGVVHSDLRPAKVLVASSGGVVVAGFGLARSALLPSGAGAASPGPEADVLAIGLMALRMLRGRRPAEADAALAELDARGSGALPKGLAEAIRTCVRPGAAARFPTATELCGALALIGADAAPEPPEARRPPERITKPVVPALPPPPGGALAGPAGPVVLVVDDDEDLQRLLVAHLTYEGFSVLTARDGVEAARALAERSVDAVLLDLWMPKADGFDVLRAVHDRPGPRAPVVMMSTNLDRSQVAYAFRMGAADVLEKPLDLANLAQRLHRLVSLHRSCVEAPAG